MPKLSLIAPIAPQKPPPPVKPEFIADEIERFQAANRNGDDNGDV